ncbi:glycosyltransferase [Colwelliaceae bacterium 6441]
MKLAIFVDQFPSRSQTFVINQIVGLLSQGVDITILSLSSKTTNSERELIAIHPELVNRTIFLLNEHGKSSKAKLYTRVMMVVKALFNQERRQRVMKALSLRLGHHGKSLLLASIASRFKHSLQFDVILCHFGYNGIVANKLSQLGVIKGKIATIFHGFDISAKSALEKYNNDYQKLFLQTELILPISDLWKNKLLELGCCEEKICVHRMGVDLNLFQYRKKNDYQLDMLDGVAKNMKLFTVARFSRKKGLEYVIRALKKLPKDIVFHYYLGGFGELEAELKQLVVELKLEDKVTFLGALEQHEVTKHMLAADVFVQPSVTADNGDMEGVPVALMEAMAMGTPVLSTFHSAIPELINHGEHGLLAKERDYKGLAKNIETLYRDKQLVNELTKNARSKIEAMSDVEKLNLELINKLTSISGKT